MRVIILGLPASNVKQIIHFINYHEKKFKSSCSGNNRYEVGIFRSILIDLLQDSLNAYASFEGDLHSVDWDINAQQDTYERLPRYQERCLDALPTDSELIELYERLGIKGKVSKSLINYAGVHDYVEARFNDTFTSIIIRFSRRGNV